MAILGAFSSQSATRTDAGVANIGAEGGSVAIYNRGRGAISVAPGGQFLKLGRGSTVNYTVTATTTGAPANTAATYLANAIDGMADRALPAGVTLGGPESGGINPRQLIGIGLVAVVLFVLLFMFKRRS